MVCNTPRLSFASRLSFAPLLVRYFNRDVECIRTFFRRRFQYESILYPQFKHAFSEADHKGDGGFRLDVVVAASGFARKDMKVIEAVR